MAPHGQPQPQGGHKNHIRNYFKPYKKIVHTKPNQTKILKQISNSRKRWSTKDELKMKDKKN
jgi:hypothetical protein